MEGNKITKRPICENNYVKQDGVIKEQVKQEYLTRENWNNRWSFVKDFNKRCLEIAREKGVGADEYKRMMRLRKEPELPSASTWDPVPSGTMPLTTAGEIGWRSSRSECGLERFGPMYVSPRHTIEPPGSETIQNYNYIILG